MRWQFAGCSLVRRLVSIVPALTVTKASVSRCVMVKSLQPILLLWSGTGTFQLRQQMPGKLEDR